jgi:hypothetical protein
VVVLAPPFKHIKTAYLAAASLGAFFEFFAPPALILLPEHELRFAGGTMPGIVTEERIDSPLHKTLACHPPHGMSALFTEHF